jgi:hypothetical protein
MTPTPRLRFVERDLGYTKIRVLQQWWAPEDATGNEIRLELRGEWRDVALEKEND